MKPQIFRIPATDNRTINQKHLVTLADHLRKGRAAVLPTETGPMLAVDALNLEAVRHVFGIKGRGFDNPIHAAVSDISAANDLVQVSAEARRVLEHLTPGPITVICPKKDIVSDLLVAGTGNLGIRVPDSPVTLQVCAAVGRPLTATSLNLSGRLSAESLEETIYQLSWHPNEIVYVVDDPLQYQLTESSTVVRFAGQIPFEVLRIGPISAAAIERAITTLSFDDMRDWT